MCVCVCVCGRGHCILCGGLGAGIESERERAVEVAGMLWWLLLLLMGQVVMLACAVWFADFGVCGVVGSGGWWPGVVGLRVDGLWWCVRGVATYGVRDEGVSGYAVCGGVGGLPRRCCCLWRWVLG